MGAAARRILSRVSPVFWVAAAGLAVARTASGGHLHVMAWVVIAAVLGAEGGITGAIADRAASQRDVAVLGRALYESISEPAGERAGNP